MKGVQQSGGPVFFHAVMELKLREGEKDLVDR